MYKFIVVNIIHWQIKRYFMAQDKNKDLAIAAGIFVAGVATPYLITFFKKAVTSLVCRKQAPKPKLYGAVEMGGTNFAVATAQVFLGQNGEVKQINFKRTHKDRIKDDNCDKTMDEIGQFFGSATYDFIGVASFGPICLNQQSPEFGSITSTPKIHWRNYPILKKIQQRTKAIKYGFDTDVNAPALAQLKLGKHNANESLVYITVGTGVGIGVVANGGPIHGLMHPQGGHMIVERHPQQWENFKSVCPYHQNCVQGYVTNNAIAQRYNIQKTEIESVGENEKVWRIVGYYLAQLCYNITLLVSPEVIVFGGGIMKSKAIFDSIYEHFPKMLNEYVDHPKLKERTLKEYIRAPTVDNLAFQGAMMLPPIQ